MNSSSLIAIKDGTFYHSIFCLFDGLDIGSGVGPTLRKSYNNFEAASKLIQRGHVSSINDEYKMIVKPSDSVEGETLSFAALSELFLEAKACNAAYLYIYIDENWETIEL